MIRYFFKFSYIFCLLQLAVSCASTNFFNIQLWDEKTYDRVNILILDVYQNAKNGNVDFFRHFVEREIRESRERFSEVSRQLLGDSYVEYFPCDEYIIMVTKEYMRQFVEAKIYRTYKTRVFWVPNGIILNYYRFCPRREIRFGMILTFDQYGEVALYRFFAVR